MKRNRTAVCMQRSRFRNSSRTRSNAGSHTFHFGIVPFMFHRSSPARRAAPHQRHTHIDIPAGGDEFLLPIGNAGSPCRREGARAEARGARTRDGTAAVASRVRPAPLRPSPSPSLRSGWKGAEGAPRRRLSTSVRRSRRRGSSARRRTADAASPHVRTLMRAPDQCSIPLGDRRDTTAEQQQPNHRAR